MKILHLDTTQPFFVDELKKLGFTNDYDLDSSKLDIEKKISSYYGIIIRSRINIDKTFIDNCAYIVHILYDNFILIF